MKIKRRIKIVTETERAVSMRLVRKSKSFFCADCRQPVEMLSINETANLMRKTWREIVRLIECGEVHSSETTNGEIYVCAVSIVRNQPEEK